MCVLKTHSLLFFFCGQERERRTKKKLPKMGGRFFKAQRARTATALLRSPYFTTPASWPQSATARCLCTLPRGSAWRRTDTAIWWRAKRKAPSSQATLQVRFEPVTARVSRSCLGTAAPSGACVRTKGGGSSQAATTAPCASGTCTAAAPSARSAATQARF